MRILFYLEHFPGLGGIEKVTSVMARAFIRDGHVVKIVSLNHADGTNQLDGLPPSTWVELPDSSKDKKLCRMALTSEISAFAPQVVIFQDSYARVERLLAEAIGDLPPSVRPKVVSVEHNRPMIWDWHNKMGWGVKGIARRMLFPYRYFRRFMSGRTRRRFIYGFSDAYVVLASGFLPRLEKIVGKGHLAKARAIGNPLTLAPAPRGEKQKTVLFVGALTERKGVGRILTAWQKVAHDFPDWWFIIAGDGPDRAALERRVEAEAIQRVEFKGFVSDPTTLYSTSAILALASSYEGWGLVLVEAMANGCVPVVCDSFESLRDIVDDGENGCIVPAFDLNGFADRMKALMADPVRCGRMASAAIKKTLGGGFSLSDVKAKWYHLFKEIGL